MDERERQALIAEEDRRIRHLRILVDLIVAVIAQDDSLTLDDAWEHVRGLKAAAENMFPGKGEVFDLIYLPRFSRLMAERFGAN